MSTEVLQIYGDWNLTQPTLPPRSRLYSLQPLGVGTPYLESLTSYVARLAEAHCVQPGSLISSEFKCLIKETNKHSYLHDMSSRTEALNGSGQMASNFVEILQQLTLQNGLHQLTLLPWAEVLPARNLLRRVRAWCPSCYMEWEKNTQIIYEPLLWMIDVVAVCLRHQRYLSSKCPYCKQQLPLLAWASRPGYCSKCQQWLGVDLESSYFKPNNKVELDWQIWVTENVGELLVHSCKPGNLSSDQVSKALSICVTHISQGNIAEFARRVEIPKNTLWLWHSGKVLPQLSMLLKICYALKLPLLEFLLNPAVVKTSNKSIITSQYAQTFPQRIKQSFDIEQIQDALRTSLREEPPPSMQSVARRLGCSSRTLRRRFPDLCAAISARYLLYRENERVAKIEECCREVRNVALKLYADGLDPTRSCVARYLGKPAYFREAVVVAALDTIRQELGLE